MSTFLSNPPDNERYSPPEIVAAAKEALGGTIDYDPCTTVLVNSTFIRAKHIYTKETDGLNRDNPWAGHVYINPPGGGLGGNQGGIGPHAFWNRLIVEYETKRIKDAVFLAYDIEQLQQSQNWCHVTMLTCPFCVPAKRLVFWKEKGGHIVSRNIHEFSSAVIYIGKNVKRFVSAFESIGDIVIPRIANPRNATKLTNWNGEPMPTGLTAPPIEGCQRDPHASTEERFGKTIEELIENPPPPSPGLQRLMKDNPPSNITPKNS